MTVTDAHPDAEPEGDAEPEANLPAVLAPEGDHADVLDTVPGWKEMQGLAAMAVTLSASALVPVALRGKPNDVFLVLLTARELGIAPTTALRLAHPIEGQVSLAPKLRMAMVRSKGLGRLWPHQAPRPLPDGGTQLCECGSTDAANNADTATWHAMRRDEPGVLQSFTFTWDDAVRTGMVRGECTATEHTQRCDQLAANRNRDACKSNWRTYPQRMVSWRAAGYLLDDVFPEVGTGLYSPDELGAVTDEDGNAIIDVASTEPLPGTKAPRGHKASGEAPDPPATDAERGGLQQRIDALSALQDENEDGVSARQALLALWTERREDGTPKLPPLGQLLARQVKLAGAVVAAIEKRAKAGEWGTYTPPAEPETGEVATEPQAQPDAATPQPEPTPEPQPGDPVPPGPEVPTPVWSSSTELAAACAEEVRAMDHVAVLAELTHRGVSAEGRAEQAHRLQLATALWTERGGPAMEASAEPTTSTDAGNPTANEAPDLMGAYEQAQAEGKLLPDGEAPSAPEGGAG